MYRFVCDVFRWLGEQDDAAAQRLIASPHSGVPHLEARASIVLLRDRPGFLTGLQTNRVALSPPDRAKVAAFAHRLERILETFRAQGATASRVFAATLFEFGLTSRATFAEIRLLEETAGAIRSFDEGDAARGGPWDVEALQRALDNALVFSASAGGAEGEAPPAAPPEDQPAVPLRRQHFSASSLNTFAECRRKWYYRYVCAAVEDKGSAASFYGTAFHAALERFHQEYPRPAEHPREELERKLSGFVNAAFERYRRGFDSNVAYELQRRRAQRTVGRYLDWLLRLAQKRPFEVVGCEVAADVEMDGYEFVGFIDRIDREVATGNVTVVDYKTGSIATSAQEYREKIARFAEFQLPFYYWARTLAGDRVTRLALVPLKDALVEVEPVELEVVPLERSTPARKRETSATGTISIRDLERARARMLEICATVSASKLTHFETTADPQACTYCAYQNACVERPRSGAERFGR